MKFWKRNKPDAQRKEPCPFCGSTAVIVTDMPIPSACYVECMTCHAAGPVADWPADAIRLWNEAPRE